MPQDTALDVAKLDKEDLREPLGLEPLSGRRERRHTSLNEKRMVVPSCWRHPV